MSSNVVIDCPGCSIRVNAAVKGAVHDHNSDSSAVLAICPSCKGPLVGLSQIVRNGINDWEYDHAERVWPAPTSVELSTTIPITARRDIKDAQKCIGHGIFSAAVVLCGRAIERLVKEKAPSKTLGEGLTALKAGGIIDERLEKWATALRKERNIGAHATDEEVSKENAQDVLDFTVAIFEYVYTLSEKYAEFMARKARPKPDA